MSRWSDGQAYFSGEELSHQGPWQNDGIYGIIHKFQQRYVSNTYGLKPGRSQNQELQLVLNCKNGIQYIYSINLSLQVIDKSGENNQTLVTFQKFYSIDSNMQGIRTVVRHLIK